MSTQQQIDDPGQWRVGDDVRIEYRDGSVLTGKARREFYNELWVANVAIRYGNGDTRPGATVTVTRTVEPIPEPTAPWALVRFERGEVMYRDNTSKSIPWVETSSGDADRYSWNRAEECYGAPVAVSLPHWSDEVDGLRARVEKLAAVFDEDAADAMRVLNERARTLATDHAKDLRALLAEGGEA